MDQKWSKNAPKLLILSFCVLFVWEADFLWKTFSAYFRPTCTVYAILPQLYPDLPEQILLLSSLYWPFYLVNFSQTKVAKTLYKNDDTIPRKMLLEQKALENKLVELTTVKIESGHKVSRKDKELIHKHTKFLN